MSSESEVLHAVIEGRENDASDLLKDFLKGELNEFLSAVQVLEDLIEEARRNAD